MWWERTHEWSRINRQGDEVELEMNSEPREHQSPKCFGGEPTILQFNVQISHNRLVVIYGVTGVRGTISVKKTSHSASHLNKYHEHVIITSFGLLELNVSLSQ